MPGFRPSYWESDALIGRPDLTVIGAGLTGLQAALAYRGRRPKADILLLERAPLPHGASTRNAGFACFGSPTELLADIDAHGEAATLKTVTDRLAGVRSLAENFAGRSIDWVRHGGFERFDDAETEGTTLDRLTYLNGLLAGVTGSPVTWSRRADGLLYNSLEAQLHPGKLIAALLADCRAAGIRMLFGCEITGVEEGATGAEVSTPYYGPIRTEAVLVATNAFAARLLPEDFPETIRPVRNQVLLSRPLPGLPVRGCFHYHQGYVYYRNVGNDRLLIGGGRHRAGPAAETDAFGDHPGVVDYLIEKLNRWHPELGLSARDFPTRWSGILAQGDGKSPVLRFARPRILVAARLAGMGVALSADLGARAAAMLP